ncbi:unnamed protein product [Paramecium octaurelia]|uniref:Uncharacterized protein n=1 Tax=Paramecium octaurelia TaxID=43137 RepID=A0A8S1TVQ2_PAROT|nr:unnamed protein product [Paramecium octaurelia]
MKENCEKTLKMTHRLSSKIFKRKVATQLISFSDAQELRCYKTKLAQRILQDVGNNSFRN